LNELKNCPNYIFDCSDKVNLKIKLKDLIGSQISL
jgi:hypothetical protein